MILEAEREKIEKWCAADGRCTLDGVWPCHLGECTVV